MKKSVIVLVFIMIGMLLLPIGTAEKNESESDIQFKVYLGTSLGLSFEYGALQIYVENVGDKPAHNVTLTDFQMDGNIIYNDRGMDWGPFYEENTVVEPGETISGYPATSILGLGRFTTTMTVTCDEGVTSTGTGNGIILGFLIFVP